MTRAPHVVIVILMRALTCSSSFGFVWCVERAVRRVVLLVVGIGVVHDSSRCAAHDHVVCDACLHEGVVGDMHEGVVWDAMYIHTRVVCDKGVVCI